MSSHVPESDFQAIFDSLPAIYLILKPDFTMVAANDARLKATMTTREGTLGKNVFDLFPDNPDDPAATGVANLKASLNRVLQTKKPDTMAVQKYDIPRPESEGGGFEERYWSPMNSPVLNARGEVAYIIHRVEDVTEFVRLKQTGAQQSKLTEELQDRVQKTEMEVYLRAQEVQRANEKLRELDRLKTEFFANVSHELRTPLTLILAPVEDLLSGKAGGNVSTPRTVLETVHNNAVRLLQMINGLLDFSKVSAGKTEVKREAVNILDLARSIFLDFKGVMAQKGIEGNLSAEAPHPLVSMDRYLYERIFFNLLSNAVKFTPQGGKVSAALKVVDGRLHLSVSDTGIGISAKDKERLFEKFFQAEGSSTRRFEGTGLGLALVKEFSQLLGGDVTVESEPGKGSVFTLSCPAPEAGAPEERLSGRKPLVVSMPVAHARTRPAPGGGNVPGESDGLPKVLVAEDNPELSAFLASLLSSLAQVWTAFDGAEALEMARRWGPDLILSDVMMPRMDGIQLTRELKENKETATIPVVLLTAMTNRESLLRGWEAGADDYLFKPFHPKELEARVRSILSGLQWRRKGETYKRQRDAMENFTHIASHDLREPLRKIITFIELFMSDHPDLAGQAREDLLVISRSATHMVRLLDSLMEYCQLDYSGGHFQEIHLAGTVKEALEGLDLKGSGAEVAVGDLPVVPAQAGQMVVVFSNLIGNALKYRQENRPPHVSVQAMRKGFEWVVSVADNGIGFDPHMGDRIFFMFERLHGKEKYAGEGMGLAICRKIIENHGGRIWAESEPGRGSTFYFTLPADREKTAART